MPPPSSSSSSCAFSSSSSCASSSSSLPPSQSLSSFLFKKAPSSGRKKSSSSCGSQNPSLSAVSTGARGCSSHRRSLSSSAFSASSSPSSSLPTSSISSENLSFLRDYIRQFALPDDTSSASSSSFSRSVRARAGLGGRIEKMSLGNSGSSTTGAGMEAHLLPCFDFTNPSSYCHEAFFSTECGADSYWDSYADESSSLFRTRETEEEGGRRGGGSWSILRKGGGG